MSCVGVGVYLHYRNCYWHFEISAKFSSNLQERNKKFKLKQIRGFCKDIHYILIFSKFIPWSKGIWKKWIISYHYIFLSYKVLHTLKVLKPYESKWEGNDRLNEHVTHSRYFALYLIMIMSPLHILFCCFCIGRAVSSCIEVMIR